jgi:hypothetical protein
MWLILSATAEQRLTLPLQNAAGAVASKQQYCAVLCLLQLMVLVMAAATVRPAISPGLMLTAAA